MCIICNAGAVGDEFLYKFRTASLAMGEAKAAMMACAEVADDPAVRERYGRAHREMVRLHRAWNCIEHQREAESSER